MENGEQHSGRFAIIPSVALEDPRMTPTLLKLLCVMGTYGNKHGYCWPKLTTLAKRMNGVTKSAISQGLKKLHDMGYLEITPRYDTGGGRTTNMYRILYDTPDPDLNGGLAPDLNGGLAPDLNRGQVPELNTLNVPSERPTLNESSAAALSSTPREQVNGAMPEAAAADHDENIITQTADAVRRLLRMGRDKLPGLRLIVAQYPGARPWLENQANLCYETLKVRPLQLKHFSNWLDEYERRRNAPREGMTHEQPSQQPHESPTTAECNAQKPTQAERVALARAAARAEGFYIPESAEDD